MDNQPAKLMPVNLLLEGQPCLVAGGGNVATRKVGHLLAAGAVVTVVAPRVTDALAELADQEKLFLVLRHWRQDDVQEQALVFAATDDSSVNSDILNTCRAHRVLCCVVDGQWRQSDFITPAIVRHGPYTATLSLGGCDPQRLKQLRVELEDMLKHSSPSSG